MTCQGRGRWRSTVMAWFTAEGRSEFEARPVGPPTPENFCPAFRAFTTKYRYLFPAHRDQEKNENNKTERTPENGRSKANDGETVN